MPAIGHSSHLFASIVNSEKQEKLLRIVQKVVNIVYFPALYLVLLVLTDATTVFKSSKLLAEKE